MPRIRIPNIPEEIIIEILYLLPAKPVARFRSVSKTWLSILTNPVFIKTHLNNMKAQKKKQKQKQKLISLFPGKTLHVLTPTSHNAYQSTKLNFQDGSSRSILGSCNGLVLLGINNNDDHYETIFLMNPTTSKYLQLPKSPHTPSTYGFGYDDYTDDYKVVTLSRYRNVNVYSLKRNSWTKLQRSACYLRCHRLVSGVLFRGALHWLGYTYKDSHTLPIMVAFDLITEEFTEIALPNDAKHTQLMFSKLMVLQGSLCVVIPTGSTRIDIYMMKEYWVQGSWIKLDRVCNLSKEPIRPSNRRSNVSDRTVTTCVVGDHELIICGNNENFEIYDVKEKRRSMFVVDGAPAKSREVWNFVESLVSPLPN